MFRVATRRKEPASSGDSHTRKPRSVSGRLRSESQNLGLNNVDSIHVLRVSPDGKGFDSCNPELFDHALAKAFQHYCHFIDRDFLPRTVVPDGSVEGFKLTVVDNES